MENNNIPENINTDKIDKKESEMDLRDIKDYNELINNLKKEPPDASAGKTEIEVINKVMNFKDYFSEGAIHGFKKFCVGVTDSTFNVSNTLQSGFAGSYGLAKKIHTAVFFAADFAASKRPLHAFNFEGIEEVCEIIHKDSIDKKNTLTENFKSNYAVKEYVDAAKIRIIENNDYLEKYCKGNYTKIDKELPDIMEINRNYKRFFYSKDCDLPFTDFSNKDEVKEVLKKLNDSGIRTVSTTILQNYYDDFDFINNADLKEAAHNYKTGMKKIYIPEFKYDEKGKIKDFKAKEFFDNVDEWSRTLKDPRLRNLGSKSEKELKHLIKEVEKGRLPATDEEKKVLNLLFNNRKVISETHRFKSAAVVSTLKGWSTEQYSDTDLALGYNTYKQLYDIGFSIGKTSYNVIAKPAGRIGKAINNVVARPVAGGIKFIAEKTKHKISNLSFAKTISEKVGSAKKAVGEKRDEVIAFAYNKVETGKTAIRKTAKTTIKKAGETKPGKIAKTAIKTGKKTAGKLRSVTKFAEKTASKIAKKLAQTAAAKAVVATGKAVATGVSAVLGAVGLGTTAVGGVLSFLSGVGEVITAIAVGVCVFFVLLCLFLFLVYNICGLIVSFFTPTSINLDDAYDFKSWAEEYSEIGYNHIIAEAIDEAVKEGLINEVTDDNDEDSLGEGHYYYNIEYYANDGQYVKGDADNEHLLKLSSYQSNMKDILVFVSMFFDSRNYPEDEEDPNGEALYGKVDELELFSIYTATNLSRREYLYRSRQFIAVWLFEQSNSAEVVVEDDGSWHIKYTIMYNAVPETNSSGEIIKTDDKYEFEQISQKDGFHGFDNSDYRTKIEYGGALGKLYLEFINYINDGTSDEDTLIIPDNNEINGKNSRDKEVTVFFWKIKMTDKNANYTDGGGTVDDVYVKETAPCWTTKLNGYAGYDAGDSSVYGSEIKKSTFKKWFMFIYWAQNAMDDNDSVPLEMLRKRPVGFVVDIKSFNEDNPEGYGSYSAEQLFNEKFNFTRSLTPGELDVKSMNSLFDEMAYYLKVIPTVYDKDFVDKYSTDTYFRGLWESPFTYMLEDYDEINFAGESENATPFARNIWAAMLKDWGDEDYMGEGNAYTYYNPDGYFSEVLNSDMRDAIVGGYFNPATYKDSYSNNTKFKDLDFNYNNVKYSFETINMEYALRYCVVQSALYSVGRIPYYDIKDNKEEYLEEFHKYETLKLKFPDISDRIETSDGEWNKFHQLPVSAKLFYRTMTEEYRAERYGENKDVLNDNIPSVSGHIGTIRKGFDENMYTEWLYASVTDGNGYYSVNTSKGMITIDISGYDPETGKINLSHGNDSGHSTIISKNIKSGTSGLLPGDMVILEVKDSSGEFMEYVSGICISEAGTNLRIVFMSEQHGNVILKNFTKNGSNFFTRQTITDYTNNSEHEIYYTIKGYLSMTDFHDIESVVGDGMQNVFDAYGEINVNIYGYVKTEEGLAFRELDSSEQMAEFMETVCLGGGAESESGDFLDILPETDSYAIRYDGNNKATIMMSDHQNAYYVRDAFTDLKTTDIFIDDGTTITASASIGNFELFRYKFSDKADFVMDKSLTVEGQNIAGKTDSYIKQHTEYKNTNPDKKGGGIVSVKLPNVRMKTELTVTDTGYNETTQSFPNFNTKAFGFMFEKITFWFRGTGNGTSISKTENGELGIGASDNSVVPGVKVYHKKNDLDLRHEDKNYARIEIIPKNFAFGNFSKNNYYDGKLSMDVELRWNNYVNYFSFEKTGLTVADSTSPLYVMFPAYDVDAVYDMASGNYVSYAVEITIKYTLDGYTYYWNDDVGRWTESACGKTFRIKRNADEAAGSPSEGTLKLRYGDGKVSSEYKYSLPTLLKISYETDYRTEVGETRLNSKKIDKYRNINSKVIRLVVTNKLIKDNKISVTYLGESKNSINVSDKNKNYELNLTLPSYNIIYKMNGGTNNPNNPSTYKYRAGVKNFADASKANYNFIGWYKDSNFKTKVTSISTTQTGNVTLYAKFAPKTYKITYILNGGTNASGNPASYTYGSAVRIYDASRSGYKFVGWYTNSGFTGSKMESIPATQAGDVKLYAKFEKTETYTITYRYFCDGKELTGVTNSNATECVRGTEMKLSNPTISGYTFAGWYKVYAGNQFLNKVDSLSSTQTGNVTLYAKFTKNK